MKSVKFYDSFFAISFLLFGLCCTSVNAQNSECNECEITKEVRRQYFKKLYINYYTTYTKEIKEGYKSRRIIAQAFIIYLYELDSGEIEDYVEEFKASELQDVKSTAGAKAHFKKLASPFDKISFYIKDCEKATINYTETPYVEALSSVFKKIKDEAKEKKTKCDNATNTKTPINGDDPKRESELTTSSLTTKIVWAFVGGLIVFILLRKPRRRGKSRNKKPREKKSKNLSPENKNLQFPEKARTQEEKENTSSKNLLPHQNKRNTDNIEGVNSSSNVVEEKQEPYHKNWDIEETIQDNSSTKEDDNIEEKGFSEPLIPTKSYESVKSLSEEIIGYFPDPSSERSFLVQDGKSGISFRSLYKITHASNSDKGTLDFLVHIDYQIVFNNLERYVYPVCDQTNVYVHNQTLNIRQLVPGKVEKRENKWYVTEKISIEFY